MKQLNVRLTGLTPLLMHNGQLADPLAEATKALKDITDRNKKTKDLHEEVARVEWMGSLYVNEDGKAIIPGECIEACIIDGAKKCRLGTQFKSSVFVEVDPVIDYGGRKKAVDLWGDANFRDTRGVRVTRNRVMRTRPIFRKWAVEFPVTYNPDIVEESAIVRALEDAGQLVGLLDYRPKFGRFTVEVL